jgi:hypothetical protein
VARSSLDDRRAGTKKKFCYVTTRGCNFGVLNDLGCEFGALAALSLSLSMPSFGSYVLPVLRLASRCLPPMDLPQTMRLLAVALVRAPWLVLTTTPFTQTASDAWSSRSGRTVLVSRTLASAHGRSCSQGKARGECANTLSERNQNTN